MPEMEERALIYDGIKHYFVVNFPQRPGALREFVNDILGPNDDITRFEYIKRANKGKKVQFSLVSLLVTRTIMMDFSIVSQPLTQVYQPSR